MPKCFVIYYSLYGHVATLSKHIQKGLESKGIDVEVYQVPETLSDSILEKMHAPAKTDDPIITVDKLTEADGFMFGIPTRFGTMPAQWRSFLDATGRLWASGALAGKFCGTFFSSASQHGGQETTAYMTIPYLAHHGINYVSFGFANASLFNNDEVIGGSAYGAGTVTNGDGSRQPSETELAIARNQAENFADILNQYQRGKELSSSTSGDATEKAAADNKQQVATADKADGSGGAGAAAATGAAAGAAAGAGVGAGAAGVAAANNTTAAGADSDASIRSIKAASTQKNGNGTDKETPVITTTNPEGHTERPAETTAAKTEDAGMAQSTAAAGTAGAAGAAATAPAAEGPTTATAPTTTGGPQDTSAQPATGATTEQQPTSTTQPPQQPKKKKSKLWRLCCGAEGLD